MSGHEWLWYLGVILAATLTLAIGYHVGIVYAAVFWAVTAMVLLLLRPQ